MTSNLHVAWGRLFMRALATSGVKHLVVSPGSRSTPLVLAAAREERLVCHVIVDERSAAFFALGQARATGEPSALLCTSGTAAAHYFPAIIEASASFTPLVVVTADRPWEAYDAASPQTIDQIKLYGGYVRQFAELGLPDPSAAALRAVVRVAAQAVEKARGPTPGPVHVNARFRKPLEPVTGLAREAWEDEWERLMAAGAPRTATPRLSPDTDLVAEVTAACKRSTRGLIVCGPSGLSPSSSPRSGNVAALQRATGFPILAEATSQHLFGVESRSVRVFGAFDAILRDPAWRARLAADVILEIGAPPTSSAYATFLTEHPPTVRAVIAAHGWNDPTGGATHILRGDENELCNAIDPHLGWAEAKSKNELLAPLAQASQAVYALVQEELDSGVLTEGRVAHDLVDALDDGGTLIVSNSNPVRDVDLYAPPRSTSPARLRVLHQRGASGIDGLLSGAAGTRSVATGRLALLTGDLAFLHDVGGLAAVRGVKGPLAIVVVQNGGGRIFEQLPIARATDAATLERFFVTPEPLALEHATAAFGIAHRAARTPDELSAALAEAMAGEAPLVIEAIVEPNGAARRARVWNGWQARVS